MRVGAVTLRRDAEPLSGEVTDSMLPRKAQQ